MGYFFSLFSLSKSATNSALNWSELALLVFGVVLVIGLVGEYKTLEPHSRRMKLFEMLVIIGVLGELVGDGGIFVFSNQLQVISESEIADANKKAGEAKTSAEISAQAAQTAEDASGRAVDASGKATESALGALSLASSARKEADSFEKDIASAKKQATEAESHLADAMNRAKALTAQLDRLTTPRRLSHKTKIASPLKAFNDMEYVFIGTCGDQECFDLVSDINELLELAGWKRIKGPPMRIGITQFLIHGDKNFAVDASVSTGTAVSVENPSLESVKDLPDDQQAEYIRAAIALNQVLASNISPPENTGRSVGLDQGTSKVVRIDVGRKPYR